jgi:hypothetical protein
LGLCIVCGDDALPTTRRHAVYAFGQFCETHRIHYNKLQRRRARKLRKKALSRKKR